MSQRAATRFHEERIDVSVITPIELDDLISAGERAREANARHRCFRAAVYHPHFFDGRHPVAD